MRTSSANTSRTEKVLKKDTIRPRHRKSNARQFGPGLPSLGSYDRQWVGENMRPNYIRRVYGKCE